MKLRRKRNRCFALSVCLLLCFLVACGGEAVSNPAGSQAGNQAGNQAGSQAGAAPAGDTSAAAPDVPVKDTVVVSQAEEPTVFVTVNGSAPTNTSKDAIVIYNIYDSLFRMQKDGSLTPSLATSFDISADGREYTYHLRDDVYFHNGYKMTAEDVVFTFDTLKELYASAYESSFTNLDHAEYIDEYTMKFVLTDPFAAFDSCVTSRHGFILSKQYFEEVGGIEGYQEAPIGTGAYKLASRVSGESITLEAFEDYWNGAPAIKTVIIKPISNVTTQFLALENGEIDVIGGADVSSCLQITNPDITWGYTPSSSRTIIQFVARGPSPLADINLRKAIQSAINKQEVIDGAAEGYGVLLDYDCVPTWRDAPPQDSVPAVPYDIEKAKEYLAASSYNGEPLVVMAISGTTQERAAQIIQGQLLALGINLEIMPVDASTRTALARTGEGIDMQLQIYGSTPNDVSSLGFLHEANANFTPFAPQILDETTRLVRLSHNELDSAARQEYVKQILTIINEEATIIPLYNPVNFGAWNAALNGIEVHSHGIIFFFEDWSW